MQQCVDSATLLDSSPLLAAKNNDAEIQYLWLGSIGPVLEAFLLVGLPALPTCDV
jgi:hypothetical protein